VADNQNENHCEKSQVSSEIGKQQRKGLFKFISPLKRRIGLCRNKVGSSKKTLVANQPPVIMPQEEDEEEGDKKSLSCRSPKITFSLSPSMKMLDISMRVTRVYGPHFFLPNRGRKLN